MAIVAALGGIGYLAADAALIERLQDEHQAVVRASMKALADIGAPEAVDALIPFLSTGDALDSYDAAVAANALGDMGAAAQPAVPKLVELLNTKKIDRHLLGQVAIALGKIQVEEAIPQMVNLLDDGRILLTSDVTAGLEGFGPAAAPAVPKIVKKLLTHGWPEPRLRAVNTLAAIGPGAAEALPTLREMATEDQDPTIREAASEAIAAIDTQA